MPDLSLHFCKTFLLLFIFKAEFNISYEKKDFLVFGLGDVLSPIGRAGFIVFTPKEGGEEVKEEGVDN